MSNNYRQYFEQNPPKFCCTSEYIEQVEIEDTLRGVHNKAVNGVDGWLPNGDPVEIKSQVFNADSQTKKGPYQLRGRSKFGGMSLEVHNEKYSRNKYRNFHRKEKFYCLYDGFNKKIYRN